MKYFFFLFLLLSSCAPSPPEDQTSTSSSSGNTTDSLASASADTLAWSPEPQTSAPPPIDFDSTQWLELWRLDSSFVLDLRYADDSNFVGETMYACGRCFLRPAAARALAKVQQELRVQGLGIKLWDCYRPLPVQWRLWNKVPDRRYVADPRKGSMHNRGAAVDLTLVDELGQELDMGTPYDFFGRKAWPSYTQLPEEVLANRRLLRSAMEKAGFRITSSEWWHFSFGGRNYPIAEWEWPCE